MKRAGYYKWLKRRETDQEIEDEQIALWVKEYDSKFHHILGYRRMRMYINAFNHKNYSRGRIQRIMQVLGIHAVIRRSKYKYLGNKPDEVAENLLKREFLAARPNEKWATDVTEFKISFSGKKIYLSAIIDLYDRSIIAYVISTRNNSKLVFDTFRKAVEQNPDARPLLHSDRGFQYTTRTFKMMLEKAGMTQSMSRVGHCIDNCPTEGFWGIVKAEMYEMYEVKDKEALIKAIEDYIHFYNYDRLQERFNGQTPMAVRRAALTAEAPKKYPIAPNPKIIRYKQHLAELAARA